MASSSSSHQQNAFSGIEPPNKRRKVEESSRLFDVFINHRGPDVKHTLATQLYNSLKERGIRAFLDSEEKELVGSFPSTIETAIRSALVHIAIVSKGYAQSPWCLAELVLMLQIKAKIIPVFYQVEPWELRYIEKGVFADAFLKYEERGEYLDKIKEWKEALQQVSYTAGYEFKNSDSSDCKDIVSVLEKEVQRTKRLHVAKYPVGLHKLVKDFERRCLDELVQDFESQRGMNKAGKKKPNVVGIFGMGGVGKTTLSKELFNQKRSEYARASFLFDVREEYASGKLPSLQSKLLKDLFCEDHRFLSSEEGASCLRHRLERSRSFSFLIVLDDIDHVEQLEALLVEDILNTSGNTLVIITTRDVGVLVTAGIDIGYHLKGLDREDGRELFCWHAFNQPLPPSRYEDLVQAFVSMCSGSPLSIIVLGRHVFGRTRWYWQEELKKLKETLPGDIKGRLKISIDTLDNGEKQIFMDIACFFIDISITKAMTIWKGSGWRARHALETLKERCLVEEVEVRYLNRLEYKWESSADGFALRMHDHLRDLGREMANELSHPRRVWHPQHLKSLELKGFRNILAQTKIRCFHSIVDKFMGCAITYFFGEPEDGSDTSLLWLQLEYLSCRPLDQNSDINLSIPSWIPLQYLQCLRISNGCFQKLWQSDVQAPSHLKELQIHETFLEEFPDLLGKLKNMEKLVLHAKDIQTDIWSLLESLRMNLRSLNVMGLGLTGDLTYNDTAEGTTSKSLVIYDFKPPWEGEADLTREGCSRTVMNDVENLKINSQRLVTKILITGNCCQRLQSLKICEMENLIEADLARMKTLNCLEITDCEKFKRLSVTPDLSNLTELKIEGCTLLQELPFVHLSSLETIAIKKCKNLKNASEICNLTKLVELNISELDELHELCFVPLSCLERIKIEQCSNLNSVSGIPDLTKLTVLYIKECPELEELPSLAELSCLEQIEIDFSKNLQNITLPTAVIRLSVRSCRDFQRVAGTDDLMKLMKLTELIIRECPELEKLPSLSILSCLKKISIYSCKKLQNITVPRTVNSLSVRSCRDLQTLAGTDDLMELTELIISECPELEELSILSKLGCLEKIEIDSCEKLQSITLPTTVVSLSVQSCRDLQRVAGTDDLMELTELIISECPGLEELSILSKLGCLEKIEIDSCEKLQSITLPTTVGSLSVQSCRDLQRVAGTDDLMELTELIISECPELEELSILSKLGCLEKIEIDSCEKLQSITLPTTVVSLSVRRCRDLQRVAGTDDLMELVEFEISDCGKLEFENLWEDKEHAPLQLRELVITGTWSASFDRFPSSISYLNRLKKIALLGDVGKEFGIKGLPEEFCDLQSLEHLELRHCTLLSSLPARFGDLRNLWHLDLCSCKGLRMLPVSFQQLTHLKYLDLSGCKRLVLQKDILENIRQLENLYLSGCLALQKLPHRISDQASMKELRLQHTSLEDLPSNIGQLGKLQVLTIGSPLLKSLPDSFGNLSSLKSLSIIDCFSLESLPKTLGHLELLEHLCLEATRVRFLPEGFGQLANLRTLKISDCPLSELDFSSFSLMKLTEINLSETLVTRISISEHCCPRLETLRLSKNVYLEGMELLPATVNNNIKGILALPIPPKLAISNCPMELEKP